MKVLAGILVVLVAAAAEAQDDLRIIVGFNGKPKPSILVRHGGKVKMVGKKFVAGHIDPERIKKLRAEPAVAYVEEDGVKSITAQTTPWGISRIGAPSTWPRSTGAGVRVAVLDTGIDVSHPDLNVVWGANFTGTNNNDSHGHGTHVAGTIGALNNTIGVVGAAPGVELVAVKVLNNSGNGYDSWIARGIDWAAANNCRVANLSLGSTGESQAMLDSINAAWNGGNGSTLIVCAAGNSGLNQAFYPAYYAACVAVASTTSADARSSFSNFGLWVDISAPGSSILSTYKGGGYATLSGTSMASPHVAGVAALVWAKFPGSTNGFIRSRVLSTRGPTVDSLQWTPGIVDAGRAVGP